MSRFLDSKKWRLNFVFTAIRKPNLLQSLLYAKENGSLFRLMRERPKSLGILIWPYQCSAWNAEMRVARLVNHFDCVDTIPQFDFSVGEKILLLDLSQFSDGVRVVIDQPEWLLREGNLALNIFKGDYRAYTLTFSLYCGDKLSIFIGGLQGRNSHKSLELYRQLTKDFYGIRPRDLLIEIVRILAQIVEASDIHAVADEHRFFRHPYFRDDKAAAMKVDYNDIWVDRGAVRVAPTYFAIPLVALRRGVDEISPKKRAMYRRRYEMLDMLASEAAVSFRSRNIIKFDAT